MRKLLALLLVLALPSVAHAQSSSLNPAASVLASTSPASSLSIVGSKWVLGFHVTTPTQGYLMAFDAASVPADGAVTPQLCVVVPPPAAPGLSATVSVSASAQLAFQTTNGIVLVFSSTGCFTKTAVSTAYFSLLYQ